MKQQDILWIRFPYSNLEESKVRPAVVVSNNLYNQQQRDLIVCAVTSNIKETPYTIPLDNKDLDQGKLPVQSRIRADKIFQVDKQLILRSFGRINNKTYDQLINKIRELIKRS